MFARFSLATLAVLSLLTSEWSDNDSKNGRLQTSESVIVEESIALDASPVLDVTKVKDHLKG